MKRLPLLFLHLLFWLLGAGLAHGGCLAGSLKGTNLSGAEFASQTLPGRLGYDYAYPTRNDLVFFQSAGMNLIRLPFRWERVQHTLKGPLDAAELAQMAQVLAWARELDLCILLDLHNYGSYRSQRIGSDAVEGSAFEDVWLRLATAFPDANSTALGLMNEPAAMPVPQWLALAQSTVLALRRAGASHWLMVGSGRWSGAHEFDKRFDGLSAAEAFWSLNDPLKRYAVELHQYADSNYSGTKTDCIAPERLAAIMQKLALWSQANHVRFFMGEFGVASSAPCLADLRTLLQAMQDNSVWLGWSYWSAGARWGPYPFSIQPGKGPEAPQLTLLREFLPLPSPLASNRRPLP
ncbi:MAG: glycoside hydrolase family 5 protein [Rhodoferax sp.]|nr:glycoside hydrolase family 5 protein [Rhodoferax sp.]